MPIYEIGYSSYEDSERIYLGHEKEFSEEEFRALVAKTAREWWDAQNPKKRWIASDSFNGMCDDVAKAMEAHGFRVLTPLRVFRPFGWASVLVPDWEGHTDEDDDLDALRRAFADAPPRPDFYEAFPKGPDDEEGDGR